MKAKKSIRILSVIIAIIMLSSSFAVTSFAETEPMQLSVDNVVEYPTIIGEIYYPQKLKDCLGLDGGKITVNGVADGIEIPGHFEFTEPDLKPMPGTYYPEIKFIPDDEETYIGFEISKDVTFEKKISYFVDWGPMEFVDPDVKLTATDVDSGKRLKDSTFNIVDLKSSLTGEIIPEESISWEWKKKATKVDKSGYYPLTIYVDGYIELEVYAYVRITGDTSEPIISKMPTVEPVTYYEGIKAGDLKLEGGESSIPGHFEIAEPEKELKAISSNQVGIVFKPNDGSEDIELVISVKVNKAPASFIDENGTPIVPELNIAVGERLDISSLKNRLAAITANCGAFKVADISTPLKLDERHYYDTSIPNIYESVAILSSQVNTNYTNTLKFNIVIEAQTVTPKISSYGNDEFAITFDNYTVRPNGTFTVTVDGKDIGVSGVKYNERFTWRPEHSGTYTIKLVYNPIENDTYNINEIEQTLENILTWKINTVNCIAQPCKYGATASVSTTLGDKLGGWKFYDENGKEIQIEYDDTQYSTITFTMPDHEITVKAIDKTQANIPGSNDDSDFFSSFLAWLNNLLARFRALMDAVAQLLQVVG